MTDNSGKTWMAIGETDDPNAIIETFKADAATTKGDPVYLSADDQVTAVTEKARAVETSYLNQLVTMRVVRKEHRGRTVFFSVDLEALDW